MSALRSLGTEAPRGEACPRSHMSYDPLSDPRMPSDPQTRLRPSTLLFLAGCQRKLPSCLSLTGPPLLALEVLLALLTNALVRPSG